MGGDRTRLNACAVQREGQRQATLLAALGTRAPNESLTELNLRELPARAQRGLQAYRANAQALAERALSSAFPTLQAMVGVEDFGQLAREFWHEQPPQKGDMGQWGAAFPEWLAAHSAMAPWPYLGDCAQLDWAVHCNERAADAEMDVSSMALLGSGNPAELALRLMPGTALLHSAWPIGTLHAAHRGTGLPDINALAGAREALAEQRAESVMVVRQGWRPVVHVLESATVLWTASLLENSSLAVALTRAGDAFDFTAWLTQAVQARWLQAVVARPAQPPT
jgi:hypothetical protein